MSTGRVIWIFTAVTIPLGIVIAVVQHFIGASAMVPIAFGMGMGAGYSIGVSINGDT